MGDIILVLFFASLIVSAYQFLGLFQYDKINTMREISVYEKSFYMIRIFIGCSIGAAFTPIMLDLLNNNLISRYINRADGQDGIVELSYVFAYGLLAAIYSPLLIKKVQSLLPFNNDKNGPNQDPIELKNVVYLPEEDMSHIRFPSIDRAETPKNDIKDSTVAAVFPELTSNDIKILLIIMSSTAKVSVQGLKARDICSIESIQKSVARLKDIDLVRVDNEGRMFFNRDKYDEILTRRTKNIGENFPI